MQNSKILIIDDSVIVTKLVKRALLCNNINGYKFSESSIIIVNNGFLAIEEFSKQNHIRFIITDVNMPDINGDELIDVLEDTKKLKDTQVIFITTKNIAKEIPSSILKKSMGIIYKPFNNITFSNQFNSLLQKKRKHDALIKNILQKQVKQKKVVFDILQMFFNSAKDAVILNKYGSDILDEYIKVDEDVQDSELAFIAYHIATDLISRYGLELDLQFKSFECAFYRKLHDFGDFEGKEFYNLQNNFIKSIELLKAKDNQLDIIKTLFYSSEVLLTKLAKKVAPFPVQNIDMFYPYFDDLIDEFSNYDCIYKDKNIVILLKNLEDLIEFKRYIAEYSSKKTLYKELPRATKNFMRCETSLSTIVFKIERILPHYIGWVNLYLWKRFFELKIFNNYLGTNLSNKSLNIQNLLLENKRISMSEYKKYKSEKIIVMSNNLELLTFFKKKLERKLTDYSFHIFPTLKHLDVWVKTNKIDRIIIDFDVKTDSFSDGLKALSYFKKIDSCFNAFFMQRLYLIVEDSKINTILEDREKYSNVHIIKKSNVKEMFLTKKLFTS